MAISLSRRTLDILANFTAINAGIIIEPNAKRLRVMKETKSVIAMANIPEDIPNQVSIYNVSEFLRCAGLFKKPVFDFQPTNVMISEEDGSNKLRYRYAEASLISSLPKKEINFPKGIVDVDISTAQLDKLRKGANTLGLDDVILKAEGGELHLVATNLEDGDCNMYKVRVSDSYAGPEFEAHFLLSNLTQMEGNYTVTVHQAITRWEQIVEEGQENLTYFIALERTSKF